jgi:hypothetical protein
LATGEAEEIETLPLRARPAVVQAVAAQAIGDVYHTVTIDPLTQKQLTLLQEPSSLEILKAFFLEPWALSLQKQLPFNRPSAKV